MDPATWIRTQAKKLLLLHPPRQAPPQKQTRGENSSGNWCACSFFKQNRAQYILSLFWDVINSPEAASSYWTQSQHWFVVWLWLVSGCVIRVLTVLISFFPNQNESSLWYPASQSEKPADGVSLSQSHPIWDISINFFLTLYYARYDIKSREKIVAN